MTDVIINNPVRVDELYVNDVILLPYYGESKVIEPYAFHPGSNNTLVFIVIESKRGIKRIVCARSQCFEFVCIEI